MKKIIALCKKARRERGSALLISLMVIVGLSMLGLGFVALSETESAISTNQRNREEALTHAEAAANVVVDWFQNPTWALAKGLMPSNDPTVNTELLTMKKQRPGGSNGYYKPNSAELLFDLPFKPAYDDRFFGTPTSPDILIDKNTPKFLAAFNKALFVDTTDGGQITEIRIWAPPTINAAITNGFYADGGDRYGVATIRVTAQRFATSDTTQSNPLATRTVQLVVTEFPFPGPNGPIQSNSAIFTTGDFNVYWGEVSSTKDLSLVDKETVPGLPWSSAWDLVEFEHGYDSTSAWAPATNYAVGDVVHASPQKTNPNTALYDWAFKCTAAGQSGATYANEPSWDASTGAGAVTTYAEPGGPTWTRVTPKNWPFFDKDPTRNTDVKNWLYQMIGLNYIDPWAQARTRSHITDKNGNIMYGDNPQVFAPYTDPTSTNPSDYTKKPNSYYNWFQLQTKDAQPDYKIVAFPHIDYDFWKQMALAGDGQGSVFYFAYAGNGNFYRLTDASNTQTADTWANSCTGVTGALGPGFYFFDSDGGKNPQNLPDPTTVFTKDVTVSGSGGGACYCMKGFIYLNANIHVAGTKGEDQKFYAFPQEPYRDVGYHEVVTDVPKTDPKWGTFVLDPNTGRIASPHNPNHGKWDYQDVNGNGKFDLYLTDITKGGTVTVYKPDGVTKLKSPTYVPVEYYEGCNIYDSDSGGVPPANPCSEPHEPYLNLIYPTDTKVTYASLAPDIGGGLQSYSGSQVQIGWETPGSETKLAKKATDSSMTALVNCATTTDPEACTDNHHDDSGPLTHLYKDGPMLEGVLYVEGNFEATGQPIFYGSILAQGNCCGSGTPSVYFDESLITGDFKSKFPSFPRVYVSSYTTENQ